MRHWKTLGGLALAAALSACASMPRPGTKFVMVVKRFPTTRIELQYSPGLSLALSRGVTSEDVKSGRLVRTHCYIENEAPLRSVRFGFALLPEGTKVKPDDVIQVVAEQAVGGEISYSRFFGRYVRTLPSAASDYFSFGSWKHLYRCGAVEPSGAMRVEVISFVSYWDFEFARAEALRNSEIGDEELRSGRIAMGECSPGVDSWARWKVRLPPGLKVKVGDYLEAIAGVPEGGADVGPIAEAVREVAPPARDYFVHTQGSLTVACDAPAIPLETGDRP